MKKSQVSDYFPNNYSDSRERFLRLTKGLHPKCEVGHWKVPSKADGDLSVDYAWLAPLQEPKTLLVLLSGIHGSETYAGAAVQTLFIEEILPNIDRSQLGILVVHAMNPYGFKHHRRCTENEVNLNRNFSVSGDLFKTKNLDSKKMNEVILNRGPVISLQSKLQTSSRIENGKLFFGEISLNQLTKGIFPGQFDRVDDLEFGGKQAEPQTQALIDWIREKMPAFKDVLALDLHTGLGDPGRLHLLTDGTEKTLNQEMFTELFHPDEDKEFYVFTPAAAEGFYEVHGATNSLFGDLCGKHQRVCAITLEFGTLGHSLEQQLEGFNSFIIQHEGHHYGYATPALEKKAKAQDFERSYPENDGWRRQILEAAEGMLTRVLKRAHVWPRISDV